MKKPMNPQPKNKAIRLKVKAYTALRKTLHKRANGGCEMCGRWAPLNIGHVHHIKTRGAGGDDVVENTKWLCGECHRAIHDGRISGVKQDGRI